MKPFSPSFFTTFRIRLYINGTSPFLKGWSHLENGTWEWYTFRKDYFTDLMQINQYFSTVSAWLLTTLSQLLAAGGLHHLAASFLNVHFQHFLPNKWLLPISNLLYLSHKKWGKQKQPRRKRKWKTRRRPTASAPPIGPPTPLVKTLSVKTPSQIEERAIRGVTGEMTRKEHMILVMFIAKRDGYVPYKDMSYEQIEQKVSKLKDGDEPISTYK